MNMDVQNDLKGFDEFSNEKYLFRPTGRDWGIELEIVTTKSPQIVSSMWDKGFTKDEIEEETNGLYCEGITEIKSLPFGFDPVSDSNALQTLYATVDEFYKRAQEVNATVTLGSYDEKTGHTAGNHIHIGGNGIEDLMKIANIMLAYEAPLMVIANPDNRERMEAFGYKYGIGIVNNPDEKSKYKKYDILMDMRKELVELRSIPMSKDLNTAFMVDQLVPKLISIAESDPEEMLRIEYLTNESPDGVSTYAEINRNRAIMDGLNAYLWDVKFVMEDNSLKAMPYERHISEAIDEYLTRAGDYQQFLFD
jgi:hypothetical protein